MRQLELKAIKIKKSYDVAFSPDSETIVTLGRDVSFWSINKRTKNWSCHPLSHPSRCTISPDGTKIAVKNTSGKIVLLDPLNGALIDTFSTVALGEGSNLYFSSDSQFILDGSWGGVLACRNASTGEVAWHREFSHEMICWVDSDSTRRYVFTEHNPKAIGRYDSPADSYLMKWIWPIGEPSPEKVVLGVPFLRKSQVSPKGDRVAVVYGAPPRTLAVLDQGDSHTIWTTQIDQGGSGTGLCWSPDANYLALTVSNGVVVFEGETGTRRRSFELDFPCAVCYSPNGKLLALGSWKEGFIVDIQTN